MTAPNRQTPPPSETPAKRSAGLFGFCMWDKVSTVSGVPLCFSPANYVCLETPTLKLCKKHAQEIDPRSEKFVDILGKPKR